MRISIVDQDDNIVRYKDRQDRNLTDIVRITHIWVFNNKGEFLIAKRQSDKKISPNKWGPSASGTLEEGDTYESNAKKELEEELGLKNIIPTPYKKIFFENSNGKRFCYIFLARVNIPVEEFNIQKEEVAEVQWIYLKNLLAWYRQSPSDFVPSINVTINLMNELQNESKS